MPMLWFRQVTNIRGRVSVLADGELLFFCLFIGFPGLVNGSLLHWNGSEWRYSQGGEESETNKGLALQENRIQSDQENVEKKQKEN